MVIVADDRTTGLRSLAAVYPDIAGKVAVVTGGSKGIGAAACRLLAAGGAAVAVVARAPAPIASLVETLRGEGGNAAGFTADCADRPSVVAMAAAVSAELGPPDICMAFVGGFRSTTPFLEIGDDEWHSVVDANLTSTFLTIQAFLPGMIERRRGAIVTMASNAGRYLDIPLTASYAAAKAGVIMLTRHVALEVGGCNVRLNCVAPATTMTERVERTLGPERLQEVAAMAPLGRLGLPEDSARAALFLASDAASWLTGVTIDVAGGRIML